MLTVMACPPRPSWAFSFGPHQELLYILLGVNIAALIIGLVAPRRYPAVVYWLAFMIGSAIFVGGYVVSFDVIGASHAALTNWLNKSALISGCYTSATKAQFFQQSTFLDRLDYASTLIGSWGNVIALVPTIISLLWLTPYARRLSGSDQMAES